MDTLNTLTGAVPAIRAFPVAEGGAANGYAALFTSDKAHPIAERIAVLGRDVGDTPVAALTWGGPPGAVEIAVFTVRRSSCPTVMPIGQPWLLAKLLPISVDGMLIVAAVVMVDDRAAGRPPRLSAQVTMAVGVAASIAANVLAAPPDPVSRVISAWPAVALMLTVEMLSGCFSRTSEAAKPADIAPDIPADETAATIAAIRWPDIHYSAAALTDIVPATPAAKGRPRHRHSAGHPSGHRVRPGRRKRWPTSRK